MKYQWTKNTLCSCTATQNTVWDSNTQLFRNVCCLGLSEHTCSGTRRQVFSNSNYHIKNKHIKESCQNVLYCVVLLHYLYCILNGCVQIVLHLMASGEGENRTGVLTPMPCPHTLPTLLNMAGLTLVPYQLLEDQGWAVELDELHRALRTTRGHCSPRAIYISNPGNPTGKCEQIHWLISELQSLLLTIKCTSRSCARQEINRGSYSFCCNRGPRPVGWWGDYKLNRDTDS